MNAYTKLDLGITPEFIKKMKNYATVSPGYENLLYHQLHPGKFFDGFCLSEKIPSEYFREVPILHNLMIHYSAVPRIWRFAPGYLSEWHKDVKVGASMMIPIEDVSDRYTLFRITDQKTGFELQDRDAELPSGHARTGLVEEVEYEIGYACILDVKKWHELANLKKVNSYILNFQFPVNAYDEIIEYCENYIVR